MNETWAIVPETNGKILVSNKGRVKSLLRDSRILKTQTDNKGYQRVRVTIDKQKRTYKIHRLVAEAFCKNEGNLPQVNHIDCDKTNNHASNLEWVSNRENAHHAINNGLWDGVIAGAMAENEKRKQKITAINIKSNEIKRFNSISEAERYYNSRHISSLLNGKRKTIAGHTFVRGWL